MAKEIKDMSNSDLIEKYNFYQNINECNIKFCKENGYYGIFGTNDYARLKTENEMLKLEIELMKRNLI